MARTQRRAVVGGEFGANGEWYEGGKFIATNDHPKSAPVDARPHDAARAAAMADAAQRLAAWLTARRERFAGLIAELTAQPADSTFTPEQWDRNVENHQAGFLASMGRTLYMSGNLTTRQAEAVAKAIVGRRSRKAFDALVDGLTEDFQ